MARLTLILGVLATVVYLLDGFRFMLNEWRNWRNKGKWLVVVVLCCVPSVAEAACSGVSPNLTAASVERTDVDDCVTASVTGDTINIPAGSSANYASAITIPSGKILHLKGAGSGLTTINATNGVVVTITNGSRVSHMKLMCARIFVGTAVATDFRIDHNLITCNTAKGAGIEVVASGAGPATPRGLVDHNTVTDQRIVVTPHAKTSVAELQNSSHWTLGPQHGTREGVYVEDNVLNLGAFSGNILDCNYSARYVARFNTFNESYPEVHSVQATHRACRGGEIYGNALNDTASAPTPFFIFYIRGGSWMMFNNIVTGTFGGATFIINNRRSCLSAGVPGFADGTSGWDENTVGEQGWLTRDQIGSGADVAAWGAADPNPPAQGKSPLYAWLNTYNGTDLAPAISAGETCTPSDLNTVHIVENRDYYTYSTATGTPQTVGVRSGTRATMDAITTCTAGVGFWVTDEGSWNTSTSNPYGQQFSGADGVLYVCGSSNNWVLNYTPYTYPHVLNIAEDEPASPTASPVVIARVLRWMEVLLPIIGLSVHFRRPLAYACIAVFAATTTLSVAVWQTGKTVSRTAATALLTHLTDRMK